VIPGLGGIEVQSAAFAGLAAALVLLAWSPARAWFLPALLAASLVVAASWLTPRDAAFMAIFLALPYPIARWAWGRKSAGLAVPAAIALQVAVFVVFKNYGDVWPSAPALIGLSYILFRQIHLLAAAEAMGGLPLTLSRYLAWTLSFLTLAAGPIQRYPEFCQGLETIGRPPARAALDALHRCVNGALKAFVVAPVLFAPSAVTMLARPGAGWLDLAVVFYGYPVYLYLNFSGYTDLMIGIARLCGIGTMPENFNRPYVARNIQDFWARWHMSFSGWIRDYLFLPLNIVIHRRLEPRWHMPAMSLAVLAVFAVVGLWHGTTLNFLLFGLSHGVAMLVMLAYGMLLKAMLTNKGKQAFDRRPAVHAAAWLLTFHFVCASLMLVRNQVGDIRNGLGAFHPTTVAGTIVGR
jgi:D-alanyl-lipoteichoic acid acyltransferase DltB (MBOAT superfamily)